MPRKTKPTLAASEKRVIKADIVVLNRARRKILADCRRDRQAYVKFLRQWAIRLARLEKIEKRETASIDRRLAILRGRLGL